MASEGPNNGSSAANDNSIGTVAWANTGNVFASDDARANTGNIVSGSISNYLVVTGFGFAIPSGATIDGIVVEAERSSAAASCEDEAVRIVKGGAIGATDKSSGVNYPSTEAYQTYGGATDKWGETWTDSDINASTFGVAFAAQNNTGTNRQARIDHVRITVYYTEAGGTEYTQSVSGTLTTAGAPTLRTGKALAGSLTSAGAVVMQTAKALAGSIAPDGGLVKRTAKALAGGLSPDGALAAVKTALISLGGTLTTAGTVALQTGKALGGTLAPDGALARSISKALAGTLTTAGDVFKRTARALAGALSTAGTVAGQFSVGGATPTSGARKVFGSSFRLHTPASGRHNAKAQTRSDVEAEG